MSNIVDILFFCNASSEKGFGHLRRCLFICSEIYTSQLDVAFSGSFDDSAKSLIYEEAPYVELVGTLDGIRSRISVIDYMFDSEDMDYYDVLLISNVDDHSLRSILISSAVTIPSSLPVDIVYGHLLDSTQEVDFKLKSGLAYAPVSPDVAEHRPTDPSAGDIERVFVGFGNIEDPTGVHLALKALKKVGFDGTVDVLIPPALLKFIDSFEVSQEATFSLELHHNVPSVPALLVQADCMIGSYGHMTFEALALGVPPLIVATKEFMKDYARRLEQKDTIVYVGHTARLSSAELADELSRLSPERRYDLSRQGMSRVDGKGLVRVAEDVRSLVNA